MSASEPMTMVRLTLALRGRVRMLGERVDGPEETYRLARMAAQVGKEPELWTTDDIIAVARQFVAYKRCEP